MGNVGGQRSRFTDIFTDNFTDKAVLVLGVLVPHAGALVLHNQPA